MDASLPTGKELRPQNAEGMNSRLSGTGASIDRGGSWGCKGSPQKTDNTAR